VLSLNRAGAAFGSSVFCPPWVDEDGPEDHFGQAESFKRYEIDTERIETAPRTYTFLTDRLGDYADLPKTD
jgi:nitrilase